jgi:hypothetical protein
MQLCSLDLVVTYAFRIELVLHFLSFWLNRISVQYNQNEASYMRVPRELKQIAFIFAVGYFCILQINSLMLQNNHRRDVRSDY